ncbi:MAG: hypothetical protein SGPRY_014631, partial [Prymnesium sp.]
MRSLHPLLCLLLSLGACVPSHRPQLQPSRRSPRAPSPLLAASEPTKLPALPCGDELDKRIFSLALPAVANFMILPLTGATDLFWVGRMGDALALAGQAAANQAFSSAAWITSVIPTITTPRVAKAYAAGDQKELQARVGEAIFTSLVVSLLVTVALCVFQRAALLGVGAASSLAYSTAYLRYRLPGLVPDGVSVVGFAVFRGCLDTVTPLQVAVVSNLLNAALDPLLIFTAGLGVAGAALATTASQVLSVCVYIWLLLRKKLVTWAAMLRPPSLEILKSLAAAECNAQIRALALNIAFIAITRKTQTLDATGTAAAAHAVALQFWQLGGVILFALSTVSPYALPSSSICPAHCGLGYQVASIVVPSELARKDGGPAVASSAANRLLCWGSLLGIGLGALQLAALPMLHVFTPLAEVRRMAYVPSVLGAVLQFINGIVFVGEGIMVGTSSFGMLAAGQLIATAALLASLRLAPATLIGVWGSFYVFNGVRLAN